MTALIPIPSIAEVEKYLNMWVQSGDEANDQALIKLIQCFPHNKDLGGVTVKVAAINQIYSTNIFAWRALAQQIVDVDIDDALASGHPDPELIEKIAVLTVGERSRRNYSFATKYCAFHRPDIYPIYDSVVRWVLSRLLNQGEEFTKTKRTHWDKDYAMWVQAITDFQAHFGLERFTMKEIDKYLWRLGKVLQ